MIIALIFQALSVSFAGVWDDVSDQDGVRPSDIAALNDSNYWKHSFSHLPQERFWDCIFSLGYAYYWQGYNC